MHPASRSRSRPATRLQTRRRARGIVDPEGRAEDEDSSPTSSVQTESEDSRDEAVHIRRIEEEAASRAVPSLQLNELRGNEVPEVVSASDSDDENESDVEFLLATDSEDSLYGTGRSIASRARSSSSESPNARVSPRSTATLMRLSTLAQSFIDSRRRSGSVPRQPEVLEIDLVGNAPEVEIIREGNNGEVPVVRRHQRMRELNRLLDSDDEVEVLPETPPEPSLNIRPGGNHFSGGQQDIIDIIEIDRPDVVEQVNHPASHGRVEAVSPPVANNDGYNDNDSDDNGEMEGPPQKMPRLDTSLRADESDGCHICFEPYDNSGGHRPCCLVCGHIFGKDCIERWIKAQKRCPDCNSKATLKDIRVIYVKNLKAIDTAELERMKAEIDKLKVEKNRVELTNARLRCQVESKNLEVTRLQSENNLLRSRNPKESTSASANLEPEPTTSARAIELAATSSAQFPALRMPKLKLIKQFPIKEGQSRVGAYSEWMNLLVVSHAISSALFPSGSFGIKKINSLDMKAFQSFPIHQRTIRDMAFSPLQNDLLLTVSLDKKAVLFNCTSNCTVQTFNTDTSLWSCCWNSVNQNIFYVGNTNGIVTSYDIRAPQQPLNSIKVPSTERSGVARLKFVPPAYQSQSFNMSGLLVQKLSSVWFSEMLGGSEADPRHHQLPLEGAFLNVDFEPSSRHVLVSARPRQAGNVQNPTSHTVCNLGKSYSEMEERDIFSCDVVQAIWGGYQEASLLCRSALFSPEPGQVYVAANGEKAKTVRVWDVANIEQKALLPLSRDVSLDFISGSVNDNKFLGIIMDNALDVYDIK